MSPISRALDFINPIDDPEESWDDKEWGVLYCVDCGAESEIVEEVGYGIVWLQCPECDRPPVANLKPWIDFVWFTIGAITIAAPVSAFFDLAVGIMLFGLVFYILSSRCEALLGMVVGTWSGKQLTEISTEKP